MNSMHDLGQRIEEQYRQKLLKQKFPYKDCYKLQEKYPQLKSGFIPDLDHYFSFIAGYSSSASRLGKRPLSELRTAVRKLENSFFVAHPKYAFITNELSGEQLPSLTGQLRITDELRLELVAIMRVLLES
jgi:hypothetical protein